MRNTIAKVTLGVASLIMVVVLFLGSGPRQVMGALPAQLKTYRMSNSTPVKSIDNFHNELEQALADIFGFTLGTNITVSPFEFDNSGRITRALPLHKAAGPVGARFRDSTTGTEVAIYQNEGSEATPSWTSRFKFNISTNALTMTGGTLTLDKIVAATSIYLGDDAFWNESNDGAGSGMDADLLDGAHAIYLNVDKVDGLEGSELGSIKGKYKNLVVSSNVSVDTTVDLTADMVILTNSSNEPYVARSVSEDVLLAETGAGGRQADITPAQNQPLYLFLIYNDATDDLEAFADDVATPDLPSGYDHWALVSWCTTDDTGAYNVEEFDQMGDAYWWRVPQQVDDDFAATDTEALDLSLGGDMGYDAVPSGITREVMIQPVWVSGSDNAYEVWPRDFTGPGAGHLRTYYSGPLSLMVAEDQTIYHRVDTGTHVTDVYVHGFRMNL